MADQPVANELDMLLDSPDRVCAALYKAGWNTELGSKALTRKEVREYICKGFWGLSWSRRVTAAAAIAGWKPIWEPAKADEDEYALRCTGWEEL